jgi:cytochrome b involved in lipid metabolism
MMFMNEGEVLDFFKKDKDNNQVIIYEGIVYDVKEYLGQHPGGS